MLARYDLSLGSNLEDEIAWKMRIISFVDQIHVLFKKNLIFFPVYLYYV